MTTDEAQDLLVHKNEKELLEKAANQIMEMEQGEEGL